MYSYCLYRSRSLVDPRSKDCAEIYLQSTRNNKVVEITGYLHQEDRFFVQYIEGVEEVINSLVDILQVDPRHSHMEILERGEVDQRLFGGWDMAFTDVEIRAFRESTGQITNVGAIGDAALDELWEFIKGFSGRVATFPRI